MDNKFSGMKLAELQKVETKDFAEHQQWMVAMIVAKCPLDKGLKKYVEKTPIGPLLKHPLYVGPIDPGKAAHPQWIISYKEKHIAELIEEGKWEKVFTLYETPFRLEKFIEHANAMDDKSYWKCLRFAWQHCETLWPYRYVFIELFNANRKQRGYLMTTGDKAVLKSLPNEFKVYRGFTGEEFEGLSWSTSKAKAKWFANRFAEVDGLYPMLVTAKAKKEDVLAYFGDRGEKEIVIDPNWLTSVKVEEL